MAIYGEIYAALEELGQRSSLSHRWQQFTDPAQPFFCLPDGSAVCEKLKQRFSRADLVDARVLDPQHPQDLHPSLSCNYLLAIRWRADDLPVQLLAGNRLLPRPLPPYISVLQDYRLRQLRTPENPDIIVANSSEDLALYWTLGLPAILRHGLEAVSGRWLESLEKLLQDVDGAGPSRAAAKDASVPWSTEPVCHSLVLADWSPASRTGRPAEECQAAVLAHLQRLQRHLRVDVCRSIWRPDAEILLRLETARRFGTRRMVREVLLDSLYEDKFYLDDLQEGSTEELEKIQEPVTLWEAIQRCIGSQERLQVSELPRKVQTLAAQQFAPLISAGSPHDPVLAATSTAFGLMSQVLVDQLVILARKCRQRATPLTPQELQTLAALIKEHQALRADLAAPG